jgi:NAD(P)-dependent dehydrogenase (short-subunit alcohol dehydrogenase family)
MIRLEGKVAIVTGGAHGIGRAIAEVFAEAGASVVIADIDKAAGRAVAMSIRNGRFAHADVANREDAQLVVKIAASVSNRIDVLCNNAAYLGQTHAALDATDEEWQRCFQVSLMGTQYLTAAALPHMLRQNSGSIINIASVQGLVGARDSVAYTSVKHGVVGFTRSIAYDYGPHNIRANAICPGAIHTRISPEPGDELYHRQVSKTFLGRVGLPREVAMAALFLASDAASYVTGAAIPVDGGWTAM